MALNNGMSLEQGRQLWLDKMEAKQREKEEEKELVGPRTFTSVEVHGDVSYFFVVRFVRSPAFSCPCMFVPLRPRPVEDAVLFLYCEATRPRWTVRHCVQQHSF